MAPRARRPCVFPGCGVLVDRGYCDAHQSEAPACKKSRPRRWYELRRIKLLTNPVCELLIECQGAVAEEVHHVVPWHVREDLAYYWDNLKSACVACHRKQTERDKHVDWKRDPRAQVKVDYGF